MRHSPVPGDADVPYVTRILLENIGRTAPDALPAVLDRLRRGTGDCELPIRPNRIMLHDTTCLPALADLAALRDVVAERGGDPGLVNPSVPVDLVIDHSVIAEETGPGVVARNLAVDFRRNEERYRFIRWAEGSLANFRVVPPGTGIIHQVNMETLATVVWRDGDLLHPDLLVATDSHTPMINAVGVVGWGVGGLEAQSAMLGEPVAIPFPRVVGVRFTRARQPGVTATDIALTVTERLRAHGVVGAFCEFLGGDLSWADRATIANMAPEYGATCAFFPYDDETSRYLALTGRDVGLVEEYLAGQGLKWTPSSPVPRYDEVVVIDLSEVEPSLAGPRRPDQRHALSAIPAVHRVESDTGDVAIAAITSCTTTANPALMVQAGLLARNAVAAGLTPKPWVKTSLSPGSRVVTRYLDDAGLLADLAKLGFDVVGYGCMTCIGNSGPLLPAMTAKEPVAVLSGNRNFEGRINPRISLAYLASPPLVVAYALAGTVLRDLTTEPLGHDPSGQPVFLAGLWPSDGEVARTVAAHLDARMFRQNNATIRDGGEAWRAVAASPSIRFPWDPDSTYLRRPPYVDSGKPGPVTRARVLLRLGDNVTTDHISPAGAIPLDSRAGRWLTERGVRQRDLNQYSTRRSNHEVMLRGAFTNKAIDAGDVYARAKAYQGIPLIVVAGRDYGAGSSRDWAAKAQALLGVRAVLAESFERIHRGNLIGMGVLPLTGAIPELRVDDDVDIDLGDPAVGANPVRLTLNGTRHEVTLRIESRAELAYLHHGGLLPYLAHRLAPR